MIHVVALLFLAWLFNSEAGRRLFGVAEELVKPPEPEPEVVMIFPEQIIPPMIKPPQKAYIRTTQNEASAVKPQNAAFQSDRNTLAASKLPPKADGSILMPTLEGNSPTKLELANRDYRGGTPKNDAVAPSPPPTATPLDMRTPAPMTPPSILKPQPAPPPSAPQPKQVAKAEPNDDSMLKKMMEELDKESARLETDRLPIEVRKPDAKNAPETTTVKPQIRVPEDVPPAPPVPKAIPVTDEVKATAGVPEKDAYSPFTRTAKRDGAISREGENAVDAVASPWGKYKKTVQDAVGVKWHSYVLLARDAVNLGNVTVSFVVDRRGVPQDIKITSDAREADPRTREVAIRSILNASIPPIPPELMAELPDGRFWTSIEFIAAHF